MSDTLATVVIGVVSGLFASGGVLGVKGLLERYVTQRQDAGIAAGSAEQQRQTRMAEATVEMAQRLSEAMIDLATETLKTSNVNILQLASGLEMHRTDSSLQFSALQDNIAENERTLEVLTGEVRAVNTRLGVVVEHLVGRSDSETREGGRKT
jgi:hypothetical protein